MTTTPTPTTTGRGLEGTILRLMGGDDFILTVTGAEYVADDYLRLSFDAGGLLAAHPHHPTMWIRMWFPIPGSTKLHQRGYTIINPRENGFDIEFALHEGIAADWARRAEPGDTITVTVMGTGYELPEPTPSEWLIAGDTASLPAINDLLAAIGDGPRVRLWLETRHDGDADLPLRVTAATEVFRIRRGAGTPLPDLIGAETPVGPDAAAWAACDTVTTRTLTKIFRGHHGIDRRRIKSQAYWRP